MNFIFKNDEKKRVFVSESEAESIKLAAKDFIKDINSVCGKAAITRDFASADVIICSSENDRFYELSEGFAFNHEEEFFYRIKNGKIVICGNGDLGTMWGIYTFSEKELGIPPYCLFDDFTPDRHDVLEIEEKTVSDFPHTRFRGWFINDEDLLDGFMHKGKRKADYAFYQNVIHPTLMEAIVETALRFRMNLIIPSTLIDIDNEPEEKLIKIISRRGLFISQHHIEPLGAFKHGIKRFLKEHGYDENISYVSNKEGLVACWKHYAKRWSKYNRIVWQLGLRGMDDKPVWRADSAVGDSDEERGALISEAIQTQYDIISAASNAKEIYTTSTVWMEGAHLLASGALVLPENTITVFADIGMSQMFGNDFFEVKREPERKYGVYYHAAYWHTGPHLSEGVLPRKMEYSYALARKYHSDYYTVINVGNIKEFTFSINLNSKIAWYADRFSARDIQSEYCREYVEKSNEERMSEGIDLYFNALGSINEKEYRKFCEKYDFDYREYVNSEFPVVNLNDGIMYWCFHNEFNYKCDFYTEDFGKTVRDGLTKMTRANEIFEDIASRLSDDRRGALHRQWCYQSYLWVCFFSAAKLICEIIERKENLTEKEFISAHKKAAQYFLDILNERKRYYVGKWKKWFAGDKKVSVKKLYELCLDEISRVKNYILSKGA